MVRYNFFWYNVRVGIEIDDYLGGPGVNIAKNSDAYFSIRPEMANKHGLVTGATGSGKTVTLKLIAESFSEMGVPVFLQDVKGDLSGFLDPGEISPKFQERLDLIGEKAPEFDTYPCVFWDVFGEKGHPMRTTISDMGPIMLCKMLELNDVQAGVIYGIYKLADDNDFLLLDFKDLVSILDYVYENRKELSSEYGNMSPQSIGAIKRKLLMFEKDGLSNMFGEPALDIKELLRPDDAGKGLIHILDAGRLAMTPNLYSSFLLWLLSEVFEELEEVGDLDKPRMVFFFDEAHLIFKNTPKFLLEKIEQIIKLIRSKGVSIFFVTQNPLDIPDVILSQLGNKVQHVLRAYTPREQKTVKAVAASFRENPDVDTASVITELATGEALISFLDENGVPMPVERVWMMPPKSKIGFADPDSIDIALKYSGFDRYDNPLDRESAYEILEKRKERIEAEEVERAAEEQRELEKKEKAKNKKSKKNKRESGVVDKFMKSAASAIGYNVGRTLVRGILGSFKKK